MVTARIRRLNLLESACHYIVGVDDNNQTREGISFVKKTHTVERMSPKCHQRKTYLAASNCQHQHNGGPTL